jgi:hypothetical protein
MNEFRFVVFVIIAVFVIGRSEIFGMNAECQ